MGRSNSFTIKVCHSCGKNYKILHNLSYKARRKSKYCSNVCNANHNPKIKNTYFKKGHPSLIDQNGSKNNQWKGDAVGYSGLHYWIRKKLGKPNYCEQCKSTTAKCYEWANKSKKYLRELTDWMRLCSRCHKRFDKKLKVA